MPGRVGAQPTGLILRSRNRFDPSHARATPIHFTVSSTVRQLLAAKPRNSTQRRAKELALASSEKQTARRRENLRNNSILNYKSAALLAGARVEKHKGCARAERTLYFSAGGNALISPILAP